jgi:hypothetical protein
MWVLGQAGNNAGAENFLVWVASEWGVPAAVVVVMLLACLYWFMWWLVQWYKRLSAAAFSTARTDLIRGIAVGFGFAAAFFLADLALRWQRNAPFWDRQAWETRIVMIGMFLLVGATTGTSVFQIQRFKKTFIKPGQ